MSWTGSKKNLGGSADERRSLIDPSHPKLSLSRQCELVGLARSSWYYQPAKEDDESLALMRLLDEQYTKCPFYGSRRMTAWLNTQGYVVNRKRTQRLLRLMGLEALYPKPRLSQAAPGHRVFPYLLRNLSITRPNQVWSTDITYIRLRGGFVYLTAVLDWYSRYVLAWELSNTMDVELCLTVLRRALRHHGKPDIFNTDQGSQYTSHDFTKEVLGSGILLSMDGRGRALDNVFVERLWRTVKYEEVYLKDYQTVLQAGRGLATYFRFYNSERLHQALDYRTPEAVHLMSMT